MVGLAAITAQAQPTIHSVYPDGTLQLQFTNTLGFGVTSAGPDINPTGITVQLTGVNLRGQTLVKNLNSSNGLTVGGTPSERTVTAPLSTNILSYTAVIVATDVSAASTTNTIRFDTLAPAFMIDAEDYNFTDGGSSGLYFPNPTPGMYALSNATDGIDAHSVNFGNGQATYRPAGLNTENTGDVPRPGFTGDYNVGWTDGGEWGNYTRSFPAGVYNVYLRAARGNGGNGSASLAMVTSDATQPNQTTANLGTFTVPSTGNWQSYVWVPLRDIGGSLVQVTLSGIQTLRATTLDGYNVNYYALFLANTNLPVISGFYPDGSKLFQPTNFLSFQATSQGGIDPTAISVQLTSTNSGGQVQVTNYTSANGLVVGGTPTARVVSVPIVSNVVFYVASISVTDGNGNTGDAIARFHTLNPLYTFESEDFDYNNGQFINNPQTNAYAGTGGVEGVDTHHNNFNGTYRTSGYNNENCGDTPRDQYIGTGFTDFNLGFNDGGYWANYSRNYPAGTYNVYMRAANGTGGSGGASFARVTSGVGTSTQTTTNIGTFTIPQTSGWQTYTWVALRDGNGNLAQVTGGSGTFRVTAGGGFNPNFYAFFPADTSAPTITGLYPNGTSLLQHTNTLRFTASSSAGIAQNNVVVTVDGVPVTGLVFSGNANSWNVSYTNLSLNSPHTATITVTANNSSVASTTFKFDTFKSSYYQIEAEDYDYDNGQFIPNPQTNGYNGLSASADVDFHDVATGGGYSYRPTGTATASISDTPRPQFASATEYNIGFFENGEWGNYTRNYPAGAYNVWVRIATGNGSPTSADLEEVTSGVGTPTQTTSYLGRFTVPSDGWDTYGWVRLNNTNNSQAAVITLTGPTNTLRLSRAVATPGANVNFLLLVPTLGPVQLSVVRVGANVQISLPTQTGFSYQIQYKNSLSDVSWTNLGVPISGNNSVQSVNDSATGTSRFYRAQISQQ